MFFRSFMSHLINYFTGLDENRNNETGLSDRMANLVRNYNSHKIHCYKPFVLSLNSRKMLDYINKVTSVSEKLKFYSDYNKLLKEIGSSYEIDDLLGGYMKNSDWSTYKAKREETPQEREARLLREKASAREAKIDLILKK